MSSFYKIVSSLFRCLQCSQYKVRVQQELVSLSFRLFFVIVLGSFALSYSGRKDFVYRKKALFVNIICTRTFAIVFHHTVLILCRSAILEGSGHNVDVRAAAPAGYGGLVSKRLPNPAGGNDACPVRQCQSQHSIFGADVRVVVVLFPLCVCVCVASAYFQTSVCSFHFA